LHLLLAEPVTIKTAYSPFAGKMRLILPQLDDRCV
jgi:hypothetical protein